MKTTFKKTPKNKCGFCNRVILRRIASNGYLESFAHYCCRKFCNRKCMAMDFDTRHRGGVDPSGSRRHARKVAGKGRCKNCGCDKNVDVHHKDFNFLNNRKSNLIRLCRSCHVKIHKPKGRCKVCKKPQKGLGYCKLHYTRFKKWGDPMKVKINQHTPVNRIKP